MTGERFKPNQSLNDWAIMLHALFGQSQNYAKSPFEILSHTAEVCGGFAKYWFKKKDFEKAQEFLPKIFAWTIALLKSVKPNEYDLEKIILQKFPEACPYCANRKCDCEGKPKPTPNQKTLRQLYLENADQKRLRGLNDFELMFKTIYGHTWGNKDARIHYTYIRMVEELAEVSEAVRFYHLYPENFENELADFIAWWFALYISFNAIDEAKGLHSEELLWSAYPGQCTVCQMMPCFCRPGPVRAMMSKPAPWQIHRIDAVTSLHNQTAYKDDLEGMETRERLLGFPASCVRFDVDDFKSVNETYGHDTGDDALAHIASILRNKARDRDRLYRCGGDEFAMLLPDFTEEEAYGTMRRIFIALEKSPVRSITADGRAVEFSVKLSAGVSECGTAADLKQAFKLADSAADKSKKSGKGTITKASTMLR